LIFYRDEEQQLLFKRLRQWRKEKAEKEGVPVFIIATNRQLLQLVQRAFICNPQQQAAMPLIFRDFPIQ
jgi:hypothetical protein